MYLTAVLQYLVLGSLLFQTAPLAALVLLRLTPHVRQPRFL